MSGTGSDNGWLEAAIAWEVCASLHRQYCKGKDALFTTRQSDFVKHAENARVRASHGQAPAQAAEPVAVVVPCYTPSGKRVALYSAKQDLPIGTQLYTAPQPVERAPLTANQVSVLAESAGYWHGDMSRADFINGIRCAEVAHGIKGGQHGTE